MFIRTIVLLMLKIMTIILLTTRCSITLKKTEKQFFRIKVNELRQCNSYWLKYLAKKDKKNRHFTRQNIFRRHDKIGLLRVFIM